MKLRNRVATLAATLVVELALCGSIWLGWHAHASNELARRLQKLGGPSQLETFVAQQIVPGLTRAEVIKISQAVGPFKVSPYYIGEDYCETLEFIWGPLDLPLSMPWALCYDDMSILTSITSAGRQ
jgi:hypothetical protein